jgi:putative DNA primase/helicase
MSWCRDNLTSTRRREIAEDLVVSSGIGRITSHESSRSELIGLCPLHKESNPSFSYNYGKDLFNCSSGCGGGDLIQLFTMLRGLDKKQGFKEFIACFAPQFSKSGQPANQAPRQKLEQAQKPKPIPEETWQKLDPLPEKWLAKLEKTRGWSREMMTRLDLRLIHVAGAYRVAIPIRNEKGELLNIRKYSPGAAENKVLSEKGHGEVRLWPVDLEV